MTNIIKAKNSIHLVFKKAKLSFGFLLTNST